MIKKMKHTKKNTEPTKKSLKSEPTHPSQKTTVQKMDKGFKHTEIGLIPEDWEVKTLGEVADIIRGGSPRPIEDYLTKDVDGINWIKIGDVDKSDKYIFSTEEKIIPKGAAYSRTVKEGDLLLSNSMSFGRPYILKISGCVHDGWLVIQNYHNTFVTDFLYYILGFETTLIQYKNHAAGSTVLNLNKEIVTKVLIIHPSIGEQTAIATVLNDADALIQKLEQLIAKKRNIKTAVMQELLKPKEGWEVKKLGEVIRLQGGFAFKSDLFRRVGIPIIRISDVNDDRINTENSVCYEQFNISKDFIAKKGDILIAMSGATTGKIGIYSSNKIAYINQRVGKFVILNSEATSQEFISHIVRSNIFKERLSKLLAQGAQPNISGKQIESIVYSFPKSKTEQTRIAQILSDMDNEIQALEKQLEKYKKIKQGMMQVLLTGKVRLNH